MHSKKLFIKTVEILFILEILNLHLTNLFSATFTLKFFLSGENFTGILLPKHQNTLRFSTIEKLNLVNATQ